MALSYIIKMNWHWKQSIENDYKEKSSYGQSYFYATFPGNSKILHEVGVTEFTLVLTSSWDLIS